MIDVNLLKKLGFKRVDVPIEESGCDNDYHYYCLDLEKEDRRVISLITNANDELPTKDNPVEFHVSIFEHEEIIIKSEKSLIQLVEILKQSIK
jgi:hypothetical protein